SIPPPKGEGGRRGVPFARMRDGVPRSRPGGGNRLYPNLTPPPAKGRRRDLPLSGERFGTARSAPVMLQRLGEPAPGNAGERLLAAGELPPERALAHLDGDQEPLAVVHLEVQRRPGLGDVPRLERQVDRVLLLRL